MLYAPRVLDLFCGAGGLSLGFQNAGCEIVGGIDNEYWPSETYRFNFPETQFHINPADLTSIHPESLGISPGDIDILIGGPPCQGFSRAGLAKIRSLGQEREREKKNKLYKQFIRFVDYYQPSYFVIENVHGMKTFKNSSFLDRMLYELQHGIQPGGYSFRAGYEVKYAILCASDFGVPQVRNRLFFIGRRKDLPKMEIIFPQPIRGKPSTLKDAISDLPVLRAPVLNTKTSRYLINGGITQNDYPKKYRTIPTNQYQRQMRRYAQKSVLNHLCRGHNQYDLKIFSMLKSGEKYLDLPTKYRRYRDDIFDDKYRRLHFEQPCWTLTAHMQKDCLAFIHPSQLRTLSAREAARIQSFPDRFVFVGPLTKLFRMIGNAVPPMLAEHVANGIVAELRELNHQFLSRKCAR